MTAMLITGYTNDGIVLYYRVMVGIITQSMICELIIHWCRF